MRRSAVISVVVSLVALVVVLSRPADAGGGFNKSSCTFNGKKLYGKIQIVTAFPDVKVQEVTAFEDVAVQKVTAFADSCGEWQFVTAFPDTKVQFVKAFPDVKIRYVTAFPGAK
jgi:hypothetical protein